MHKTYLGGISLAPPTRSHHWNLCICLPVAPRLVYGRRKNRYHVSATRKWQLATSVYVANRLPVKGFFRSPKRSKSLGHMLSTGLRNGNGTAVRRVWTMFPTVPNSHPMTFISLDQLRSKRPACNLRQTPTYSKLSSPTQTLDTNCSTPGHKSCCHGETNA
jgi:hypothetical protein